jgi:D-alanyl-D-alanine carboxypeptidase/D-alanyl-D-alanine-endopeptidase (penicillin-binding protein 4)
MVHAKSPAVVSRKIESRQSPSTQKALSEKVEAIVQKILPSAPVGIIVQDAKTGKVLYERNSAERFVPASTAKVLTASAALIALGPDFTFETALKALPATRRGSVIKGDVFVTFSGDPSLKSTDLQALIQRLAASGINTIYGDVIIDNTRFQGPNYAPGWTWDSIHWHYSAPITSVIINQNRVGLTLRPGTVPGGVVQANIVSDYRQAFSIYSAVRAATEFQSNTGCQLLLSMDNHNQVMLGGCWPVSKNPVGLRLAVNNPDLVARQIILNALKSANIHLHGNIKMGMPTPQNSVILVKHQSKPLSLLLKNVLKDSNNIYAESLTKTLGFRYFQQGTFKAGTRAIKKILSKPAQMNVKRMKLLDGSGQSRYNLLSPKHLNQVLYMMYHHSFYPQFKEGLAISGKSGTLKWRMGQNGMLGNVVAKTGTLEGVSTLSGYLTLKNQRTMVFTIMTDRVVESTRHSKLLEAQLCQLFMNYFSAHPPA